jgi:hypothetical protein
MIGVRFPAGAVNFSLRHDIHIGSGVHSASYPMGARGSFLGAERPGREADHLLVSSGAIPPFPQYVFMARWLVKHRDNFTLPSPSFCVGSGAIVIS